ncbi:MAG: HlyD family efflux transporter periplasmic adaptor subunit [Gemmatimonadaceae bacterium]|nr:HlyD family efflux transporter periplasmic adaptor subunit [Gemmatimonadaceae bacterium]
MLMTRARALWIVGAVVVVGAVSWRMRPAPLAVEIVPATFGSLRVTLEEDGRTRVRDHVEIAAPITGRVDENRLVPGDSVAANGVVATMHPAPLDARARAEGSALIAQAASRTREARSQVAQVQLALDEARRDRSRAVRLAAEGALSDRQREEAERLVLDRERELDVANARVNAAREGERAARAALLGASPASGSASAVRVPSPIRGRVLRVFEAHDRVVMAGTPLVEVGDPASLEVVSDILSRDASQVAVGMTMEVRSSGRPPMLARVSRIEPAAFTKRSALGVDEQRVNVIGQFEQPVSGLGDAFEVDVSIILWQGDRVLRIPSSALVPLDSGWAVLALVDGRARRHEVRIGRRGGREVEVTGGLAAGALVIVRPDERIVDGSRVRPAP